MAARTIRGERPTQFNSRIVMDMSKQAASISFAFGTVTGVATSVTFGSWWMLGGSLAMSSVFALARLRTLQNTYLWIVELEREPEEPLPQLTSPGTAWDRKLAERGHDVITYHYLPDDATAQHVVKVARFFDQHPSERISQRKAGLSSDSYKRVFDWLLQDGRSGVNVRGSVAEDSQGRVITRRGAVACWQYAKDRGIIPPDQPLPQTAPRRPTRALPLEQSSAVQIVASTSRAGRVSADIEPIDKTTVMLAISLAITLAVVVWLFSADPGQVLR